MTTAAATAIKTTKTDSVFDCPRCDGRGHINEFRHIKNGVCFLCAGAKVIEMKAPSKKVIEKKTQVVLIRCHAYEMIEVWMNGTRGLESVFCRYINDGNRDELRRLWAWFRANGAKMIVKEN